MQRSPINIPPNNELTVPALEFVITECVSENGLTTKVLDLKYMQSNNIVRCVTIGCDVNDLPIEKHVTYKFQWDMARVAKEWYGGARVSFQYMETPRYEKQWTYLGSYKIGVMVTANPETARTLQPYLLGKTIQEEVDFDIQIPRVDESRYATKIGYTSNQTTNLHLAGIMEDKIHYLVSDWSSSQPCSHCKVGPCVWVTNIDNMVAVDTAEHDAHVDMRTRRNVIYRQMSLIINDGPIGVGIRAILPPCVVAGVVALFPDAD